MFRDLEAISTAYDGLRQHAVLSETGIVIDFTTAATAATAPFSFKNKGK
jgi:hypothetical protein